MQYSKVHQDTLQYLTLNTVENHTIQYCTIASHYTTALHSSILGEIVAVSLTTVSLAVKINKLLVLVINFFENIRTC